MRSPVRIALIDLGGTLMIEEESSEELSRRLASSLGLDTAPSYSRVYQAHGLRTASLCEASLTAAAYHYYARSHQGKIDPVEAHKLYEELAHILAKSLKPLPGAIEALQEIRSIVDRVVVVSNASSQEAVEEAIRINGLSDLVDAVVTSRLVGVRKPDPRIFIYALGLVAAKPTEAVHIGDRGYEDIWGAARLGIRTIHVARDEPPSPIADETIPAIREAPRALERIINAQREIR